MNTLQDAILIVNESTLNGYGYLKSLFNYFITDPINHKTGGYHNLEHSLQVFIHADKIMRDPKYNIPALDKQCILIAALYHDANHSRGELTDDENINRAIEYLDKAVVKILKSKSDLAFFKDSLFLPTIKLLIQSTKYPYDKELFFSKKGGTQSYVDIIRDADNCMTYLPNWYETCVLGLAEEQKVDLVTQLDRQIFFMKKRIEPDFQSFTGYWTNDACFKMLINNIELLKSIKTSHSLYDSTREGPEFSITTITQVKTFLDSLPELSDLRKSEDKGGLVLGAKDEVLKNLIENDIVATFKDVWDRVDRKHKIPRSEGIIGFNNIIKDEIRKEEGALINLITQSFTTEELRNGCYSRVINTLYDSKPDHPIHCFSLVQDTSNREVFSLSYYPSDHYLWLGFEDYIMHYFREKELPIAAEAMNWMASYVMDPNLVLAKVQHLINSKDLKITVKIGAYGVFMAFNH